MHSEGSDLCAHLQARQSAGKSQCGRPVPDLFVYATLSERFGTAREKENEGPKIEFK